MILKLNFFFFGKNDFENDFLASFLKGPFIPVKKKMNDFFGLVLC